MKKLIVILLCTVVAAIAGIYTRPSYILIGQLNWIDVVTKGYYVGSISKFLTQGMIDESFYWVLKFVIVGFVLGVSVIYILGGTKGSSKGSKKKKA